MHHGDRVYHYMPTQGKQKHNARSLFDFWFALNRGYIQGKVLRVPQLSENVSWDKMGNCFTKAGLITTTISP